uniref:Uncharacterized protein n=1 Tax=Panagrolaimus sp. JU765 TaxID=591449 RepID=A0AC34QD19_9BILA
MTPDSSKTLPNYGQTSMIRSASGYLDEHGFSKYSSKNQQHFEGNNSNKTDYDASAEISPTDSRIEKFTNHSKIEQIPTPTASHLPRPMMIAGEIQPKNQSETRKQLESSFESQETARIGSFKDENSPGQSSQASDSKQNQNLGFDSRIQPPISKYSVKITSPQNESKTFPSGISGQSSQASDSKQNQNLGFDSRIQPPISKYSVKITSPQNESKTFTSGIPDSTSPTSFQTSFYDNVSAPNVLVTNVSVNLQQPKKSSIGMLTTRVIASTHPTPTAPSSSQFSSLNSQELKNSNRENLTEEQMRAKFVRIYGSRKAPTVESESEEAPKDPKPSKERKQSLESTFSTDSRESVVSAVSYRAENKVRRNFNY